jgi:type IV secretion system protein VirB8
MARRAPSKKVEEAVAASVGFEVTIADMARRSERRAWIVATIAIVMALVLAGGYFYILPLKEKVPYIVMADAYTGTSSVARLTDDLVDRRISSSEAINRSNVAHFVLARESYDLALTNLRDWRTVLTMAGPQVAPAYTDLHASTNPDSPYKTYGKDRAIRVKILSIVLLGGGQGVTPKGATVRFQRTIYNKLTGSSTPLDSKLATLTFAYKPNLKMDDINRVENPLGFQVTDYRVDNDYNVTPPEESTADATAATTPAPAAAPPATDAATPPAPPADAPQAVAVPLSPIPTEATAPVAAHSVAPAPAAAPAARAIPRNAANGGRR